ncbi:MAG: hypothetical protein AMXMBFR47_35180 [Planctomycetota bacterium]
MPKAVPGRRLFVFGCYGLLLFGLAHALAVVKALAGPANDAEKAVVTTMQNHVEYFGPLKMTAWGAMQTLSTSYSILLIQSGVLSLLLLDAAIAAGRFLALTIVNILFLLAILVVSTLYQILPPMVFAAAVAALFAASMFLQKGPHPEPDSPPRSGAAP